MLNGENNTKLIFARKHLDIFRYKKRHVIPADAGEPGSLANLTIKGVYAAKDPGSPASAGVTFIWMVITNIVRLLKYLDIFRYKKRPVIPADAGEPGSLANLTIKGVYAAKDPGSPASAGVTFIWMVITNIVRLLSSEFISEPN